MRSRFFPLLALSVSTLMFVGCSSTGPVKLGEQEQERLFQAKSDQLLVFSSWSLEGRLAVSNETDGGSGQFRWKKSDSEILMDFHGALGRGAWKLEANAQGAELVLADGTIYRAGSIDHLIRQQVGWEIPVENLSWWVRGLAAPGKFRSRVVDDEGNISLLLQDGWSIEYDRYRVFDDINLPVKLTAHKGDWKVKLAIRNWSLTAPGSGDG